MSSGNAYQSITELTGLTLFKRFEGGAVYTQEHSGKYNVAIDESSIASLLPPEELEDMALIKVPEFNSEQERLVYLASKYSDFT